jgi:thiol-disulfide isomerase/thioredoxin
MRTLFLVAGLLVMATAAQAQAATEPFTQAGFEAAQKAGKPILVEIDASWCPTCAKQRPIIGQLETTPEFANLVILKVDFDKQKDVVREMGANMQSTLVAFHGTQKRDFSVGETDPGKIKAVLASAES